MQEAAANVKSGKRVPGGEIPKMMNPPPNTSPKQAHLESEGKGQEMGSEGQRWPAREGEKDLRVRLRSLVVQELAS